MDSTSCRAQRVLRRICLQLSFTPVLCCEGRGSLRFLPTVHGDVGGPGHTTLQATNTADMDSAPSLYHDYVSLHFYQVMKASTACRFAAKVLETGNVSLLTEASKLQARDADFGKNLQYSGGMEGNWEPDYQLVLVQLQETPSMEITQYNLSGCLARFVKPLCSAELSAVRSLTNKTIYSPSPGEGTKQVLPTPQRAPALQWK